MPFDGQSEPSETELKFTLGLGALQSLADHPVVSNPGKRTRLRSVYYDTAEHELRDHGLSLRVRECDGRFVQTLKSNNGSVIARGEWENEVGSCAPEPAQLREGRFGEIILGVAERLTPAFVTVIDRSTTIWRDGDTEVEVSLDVGEIVAHGGSHPVCELELELRRGDVAGLFRLGRELSAKAVLIPSFRSKAERGYLLAGHAAGATIRADAAGITRKSTVEDAFRRTVRTCLRQIAGNAELFESARTPRALHQVRVGIRRLRAAQKIFKGDLDPLRSAAVKRECSWLSHELELARDIEVFADRHFAAGDADVSLSPPLAALHSRLLEAHAAASEKAARAFRSDRFARLLLELAAWAELPGVCSGASGASPRSGRLASDLGRERLAKFARAVRKACRRFDDLDPVERHHVRLQVKTLRYSAEALAGAFRASPDAVRRYVEAAKLLQDHMGDLNDLEGERGVAIKIVGSRASDLAFTAGVLVAGDLNRRSKLARNVDKSIQRFLRVAEFWTSGKSTS